jgi:hypothetical protein
MNRKRNPTSATNFISTRFPRRIGRAPLALLALLVLPLRAQAGGVVTTCTEAALRAAMSGGGSVTFACDGLITLSNTITIIANTVLDAAGHQITISGGNAVRAFCVNTNVAFSLAHLTITKGQAPSGAGILNAGGFVEVTNCVFSGCSALTTGVVARGGAIQSIGGEVYLFGCAFTANHASGAVRASALDGGSGWGGAVDNSGTLTADLCNFIANSATGAPGISAKNAGYPWGTSGGSGGDGAGGAICNLGTLTILRSTFTSNSVAGGTGGSGNDGLPVDPGGWGGAGGSGAAGKGGAIYNAGSARVVDTTFAFNPGSGGNGGSGGMGGISPWGQGGNGGFGGTGGDGVGAVFNSGQVQLINSTFAFNSGSAGDGGAGGEAGGGFHFGRGGQGACGGSGFAGICSQGDLSMTNCTVALNTGAGGNAGQGGSGNPSGSDGGTGNAADGIFPSGARLVNTVLATRASGCNCYGSITDLGHNLSSDGTCNFTAIGSMNNTDPKLGPLTNNGGPTLTMALLPGSPAIDAGDSSLTPAMDQRGCPRPAGLAADIGSCEYGSFRLTVAISRSGWLSADRLGGGDSPSWCRLLSSSNLSDWTPVATNALQVDGITYLLQDPFVSGRACRFYRLQMP